MARLLLMMFVVLSFTVANNAQAAVYNVNAASTNNPAWTVSGTFEYDGATYSNWSLTSAGTGYPDFTYTPANSQTTAFNFFGFPTSLGPQNFSIESLPGSPAPPDGGALWLKFSAPLPATTANIDPGGISTGSTDARLDSEAGTWFYVPLTGVVAEAGLALGDVSWVTIGTNVQFHLRFENSSPVESEAVSGQVSSQLYGAFLDNLGLIDEFDIPPIPPDSFFDVFFEVPLDELPPSAEEIVPSAKPGAAQPVPCPPDNFWNGNVDVIWSGAGGTGQVNAHFGTILVCPGAGDSYIHVIMDCQDPAGVSWNFAGLCTGFTAALVSDSGGVPGAPAPNPIPQGVFDGWICVSAGPGVTVGTICNLSLNVTCGQTPASVNLSVEACDWSVTPVEHTTWGRIKSTLSQ